MALRLRLRLQSQLQLQLQRCHLGNKTLFQSSSIASKGPWNKHAHQTRCYHASNICKGSISDGPGISPISAPYPSPTPVPLQDVPPLYGKVAFITGGSSGIGLAIAKRFMWEGAARVVIAGRDRKRLITAMGHLDETMRIMKTEGRVIGPVDELGHLADAEEAPGPIDIHESGNWDTHASGHGTSFTASSTVDGGAPQVLHFRHVTLVIGDVSHEGFYGIETKALLDKTHILVNSAGVSYSGILPLAKTEDIQSMIGTNLYGTTLACRSFLHRMLKLRTGSARAKRLRAAAKGMEGNEADAEQLYPQQPLEIDEDKSIINISSLQALSPQTGAVSYAATKSGVITLTKGIVNELASLPKPLHVRANVIVPGYIDTDILLDMGTGLIEQARRKIPAGRLGTVDEVADAAFFLTKNKYCNGTVLNIDGGLGSRSP